MSLYRRFVTYLFLYEDMKKGKNCGFAKVDALQGRCRMEVQMKGCPDGEYQVYMIRNIDAGKTDEGANRFDWEPEGMEIGILDVNDGFGSAVYMLDVEKIIAADVNPEDIFGIYLTADGNAFVASQWEDGEVDWSSFRVYEQNVRGDADEKKESAGGADSEISESGGRADEKKESAGDAGGEIRESGSRADEKMGAAADISSKIRESINRMGEKTGGVNEEIAGKINEEECEGMEAGEEDADNMKRADLENPEVSKKENRKNAAEKAGEFDREKNVIPEVQGRQEEVQRTQAGVRAKQAEDRSIIAEVQGMQTKVQVKQSATATDISPYMTAWEKQWQQFCARHPVFCPFDEVQNVYAVKLDLRDLRNLPRQYRSLANNSFLLHGYFNYRYLLFGCADGEKKRWFLAVPGVFHNQEQMLAGVFGFTEFRTKQVTKQKTGEFGFWYRYLEM